MSTTDADAPRHTEEQIVVDEYGNTEADPFEFCTFPNCGCDGERLCQARSGANANAVRCNVEGMYQRGDRRARRAKMELIALVHNPKVDGTADEPAQKGQ